MVHLVGASLGFGTMRASSPLPRLHLTSSCKRAIQLNKVGSSLEFLFWVPFF